MAFILASGSQTRADMLTNAGIAFEVDPARVDEDAVKTALVADGAPPRDIADALADLKARAVAMRRPEDMVMGADQILVCDGKIFSKADTREEAAETLKALSGKSHQLLSAAVIYEGGQPTWRAVDTVKLSVRPLSDAFIEGYLDAIGDAAFWSVGAYQIEGRGAQLFTKVEGDHFTVLGLPLFALLDFLRRRGMMPL
ncbi:Maf family protein [Kordiimonas lacus]|uniref:Nucleoside triphosphate pyrophosphatase n=1 Tax=Kordiimonas lacus TaxID=637679 RepID=A0A1G6TL50_9PROT|nr:nucleoside triphosphate pyrophosphatase [Kordiimonas lacus]SDD29793.1 septum formation protein [Kordiimonas lacus]